MQEKRFIESAEGLGFQVLVVRSRRPDSYGPPRPGGANLEGAGE